MPSYLQIENISKSYGTKVLFDGIGFNVNEGDKIALIAPNGAGKTTLMRILAGKDKADAGGKIMFLKDIRIAFLEQDYDFDPEAGIFMQILSHSGPLTSGFDEERMEEYRHKVRVFLTNLGMKDLDRKMKELSGGEIKRVAIAELLASDADFLIMDEPTNHLDTDAIEYLEGWLSRSRRTLLMVSHDRYFLDRVCNTIMELYFGSLYSYRGNYQNFLEKREERIANFAAQTDKARNILKRELEWMHSTPQARSGKAQYRIDAFYRLKERAEQSRTESRVSLGAVAQAARSGSKIVDFKDVSFHYGDKCYLDHFSYKFQRYDKVGIVGRNGAGKTTFINLLTGEYTPDMVCTEPSQLAEHPHAGLLSGVIERGESLRIGYYRQIGIEFNPDDTVLDIVNDAGLLNRFLFGHDMLSTRVERLSGGEKRRLYLLTVLMRQPNLLVLDEPTNDLDIVTLNILEEYLKEYGGTLIIVSHDRHFLDRVADHLFIFCGDGVVKDFNGSYSEYREYIRQYEARRKAADSGAGKSGTQDGGNAGGTDASVIPSGRSTKPKASAPDAPRKLTYKEKKELEQLESDIDALNAEKAALEKSISEGGLDYCRLNAASARIATLITLIDAKETRWLELSI